MSILTRRTLLQGVAALAAAAALPLNALASAGYAAEDRTAWLQARLDAGGTIALPRGESIITATLLVRRSGTTLTGKFATLTFVGGGDGFLLAEGVTDLEIHAVTINVH